MLLDINAYIGHWPFKRLRYNTCASLLERMNEFGVDVSVKQPEWHLLQKHTVIE
ncbi:MAG: amidohydrolase 2 [Acidobacteria bacterium]|nr:amidohydrolase 2 [Acidobacteriota bacterium]